MTKALRNTILWLAAFSSYCLPACSQNAGKKIIETKNAPSPIGPYSQAVQTGNLVFVSGQIGKDPVSGSLINDNIKDETAQVMKNVKAVLEADGLTMENIVKTTVYLTDINDFKQVNEIYGAYFKSDYPARETVEVSHLPAGAKVEISVIAEKK